MLQPASVTLWTFLELEDSERVRALVRRLERNEGAGVTATAIWAPKEFAALDAAFRSTLNVHPDPVIEGQRRASAIADGAALRHPGNLIQVATPVGAGKR